jgi:hypothetical protein
LNFIKRSAKLAKAAGKGDLEINEKNKYNSKKIK